MALKLGIDIGGTKIALAIAGEDGVLRAKHRRPLNPSGAPERDLEALAADARALMASCGGDDRVTKVGVALPGPVDREAGCVIDPPNLPGWGRVAVGPKLGEALGLPVTLENDANAAALAEWRYGAGRAFDRVVYLTMSTGVGGGLVLDGRLYRGEFSSAGEVGHAPIEWQGELCACGRRGCLEAYVGGAAWARRLREIAPAESRVMALAGSREALRPEHLVEAAREGDAFALAEFARYNDYLARGIVQLVFTLAPQCVVLGTIPSAAGDRLCLDPIREQVQSRIWPFLKDRLKIIPAELGERLPYYAGLCAAS